MVSTRASVQMRRLFAVLELIETGPFGGLSIADIHGELETQREIRVCRRTVFRDVNLLVELDRVVGQRRNHRTYYRGVAKWRRQPAAS